MCQEKFYVWFSFQLPQQVKHHRLIKSKAQIVQNTALYQLLRRNSLYSSWKQDRSISFWKMIMFGVFCRPKQINEHVENIGSAAFRKRLLEPVCVSLQPGQLFLPALLLLSAPCATRGGQGPAAPARDTVPGPVLHIPCSMADLEAEDTESSASPSQLQGAFRRASLSCVTQPWQVPKDFLFPVWDII